MDLMDLSEQNVFPSSQSWKQIDTVKLEKFFKQQATRRRHWNDEDFRTNRKAIAKLCQTRAIESGKLRFFLARTWKAILDIKGLCFGTLSSERLHEKQGTTSAYIQQIFMHLFGWKKWNVAASQTNNGGKNRQFCRKPSEAKERQHKSHKQQRQPKQSYSVHLSVNMVPRREVNCDVTNINCRTLTE